MSSELVAFPFRDDKHAEKEVIETPQFTITSKQKAFRDKANQGNEWPLQWKPRVSEERA